MRLEVLSVCLPLHFCLLLDAALLELRLLLHQLLLALGAHLLPLALLLLPFLFCGELVLTSLCNGSSFILFGFALLGQLLLPELFIRLRKKRMEYWLPRSSAQSGQGKARYQVRSATPKKALVVSTSNMRCGAPDCCSDCDRELPTLTSTEQLVLGQGTVAPPNMRQQRDTGAFIIMRCLLLHDLARSGAPAWRSVSDRSLVQP